MDAGDHRSDIDRDELAAVLIALAELLSAAGEHGWARWALRGLGWVRNGDPYAGDRLLRAYGGIGRFTALRLRDDLGGASDGVTIGANERLDRLRRRCAQLARGLQRDQMARRRGFVPAHPRSPHH